MVCCHYNAPELKLADDLSHSARMTSVRALKQISDLSHRGIILAVPTTNNVRNITDQFDRLATDS